MNKVMYCGFCETFVVVCGTCGNNSCNGGTGYDGECPDCWLAYEQANELLGKQARIQPAGENLKETISNMLKEVRGLSKS